MKTTTKYPHHDVIIAWLDGKRVQMHVNGQWVPYATIIPGKRIKMPQFAADSKFRVAREKVKYRLWLCTTSSGPGVCVVWTDGQAGQVEALPDFIRWIGDWQEVEV